MKALKRPKSLTELVTEEVRSWIINGQIQMGDSLSEVGISRDLDVSRTPVREAINRLESEGLVRTEPNRGTFVFRLEPDELVKICDVRVCLETTAMRAAFDHDRKRLTESLDKCLDNMRRHRERGEDTEYLQDDTVFHQILFDCADNRFLSDAYHTISAMMAALRMQLGRHARHMEKSFQEHIKIVDALKLGDLDDALRVLENHIGRKEGSYWTDVTNDFQR
ncbi:GntR family transcriptional regulator [Tropicimonas marinistellae]|uniref:GntR family transcriptional regulator n=1 Tax=Tropicimonas marinistellae TaxID=1739787 RepID=UPI000A73B63C|nr:GntR family transcriptional regulator [Tropicimonas marinistellae]